MNPFSPETIEKIDEFCRHYNLTYDFCDIGLNIYDPEMTLEPIHRISCYSEEWSDGLISWTVLQWTGAYYIGKTIIRNKFKQTLGIL